SWAQGYGARSASPQGDAARQRRCNERGEDHGFTPRSSGHRRTRGRYARAPHRAEIDRSVFPIHRDDAGAAETEVVLQRDLRALDLPRAGEPAELLVQLEALREPRGAERVALREKTTRRVHHPLAAVGGLILLDETARLALAAEAEALVGDELVRREAIVQLDDLHVLRTEPALLVDLLGGLLGEVLADHLDHGLLEARRVIGRHRHGRDRDALVHAVLLGELLGAENRRRRSVARRAALELGERLEDHRRRQDLLQARRDPELRALVGDRVLAVLHGHLRELLLGGAVLLHVLAAGA